MKIKITALSGSCHTYGGDDGDHTNVTNVETLTKLAALADDQSVFSDYFDGRGVPGVTGGYMSFSVVDGKMYTHTIYYTERKLTEEEEEGLISYTQGQWSDGIGEGFEQEPIYLGNKEYYLSPWYWGQQAELTYLDD